MNGSIRKTSFFFIALIVFAVCFVPFSALADDSLDCEYSTGTNIGYQNYSRWSSPVDSYLVKQGSGYMKVQYASSDKSLTAAYYDGDFNLTDRKTVQMELPVFGGFCSDGNYYYVITGQNNPDESDSVQVYCITKYDSSWNRISSCGLYGANTTVPFDAGSCRMDISGSYLIIRTCHEMYTSSDGLNHQANVTIQVNIDTMEITDSYTVSMNSDYGYVSHSFNQFVKVDNNKIVAVDHGDAYPRAICLMIYPNDMSDGTFQASYDSYVNVINVLSFAGSTGDNTTGASVGGFDFSSSSYLIAGNTVVQNDDYDTNKTRNIFVASVNKSTKAVTMNYITDYEEGTQTTTTPHLVSVGSDRFALIWTRGDELCYTFVDGNGNQTSQIYTCDGSLSDCKPMLDDGYITWYTWDNAEETFYRIKVSDPDDITKIEHVYGHDYEVIGSSNGLASLRCRKCGNEETGRVPTSFTMYWSRTGSGSYSTNNSRQFTVDIDTSLYYWINKIGYSADSNITYDDMIVELSDPSAADYIPDSNTMGGYTWRKAGLYNMTIYPKYNPDLRQPYVISVVKPLEGVSLLTNFPSPQSYGRRIRLNANADGGKGTLWYKFTVIDDKGNETVIQDYSRNSSKEWTPAAAGDYSLRVDVYDSVDQNSVYSDTIDCYSIEKAHLMLRGNTSICSDPVLTYGQKVGDLPFGNAAFASVININNIVSGTLTWDQPDTVYDAGTHKPGWTFTPNSSNYEILQGTCTITVKKAVPVINELPDTESVTYHPAGSIAGIGITGGSASTSGTWQWSVPDEIPTVSTQTAAAVFVPTDQRNYEAVSQELPINVAKAVPYVRSVTASDITYGDSLKDSSVSADAVYSISEDISVPGSVRWIDDEIKPAVKDSNTTEYAVIFEPADSENYESIEAAAKLLVNKADTPPNKPEGEFSVPYTTETLTNDVLSGFEGWEFASEQIGTALTAGEVKTFTVIYTGADAENYENTSASVTVKRSLCDHSRTEIRDNYDPDCINDGYTGDTYCLICSEMTAPGQSIMRLGHDWDDNYTVDIDPTCINTGYKSRHCLRCSETIDGVEIPLTAHTWDKGTVTKKATCTEGGIKTFTCTVCQATRQEPVAETGHDIVTDEAIAPTYTSTGLTQGSHCSRCGIVFVAQEEIPMLIKPADEDEQGGSGDDQGQNGSGTGDGSLNKDDKPADGIAETEDEEGTLTPPEVISDEKGDVKDPESVEGTEKDILGMSDTKEPKGSAFGMLRLGISKSTKTSHKLKWTKVKNASGYIIYGNKCGKKYSYTKLAQVSGKKTSWTHKKLKKGTYYKYIIVAYQLQNGTQKVIARSKTVHAATTGGKVGNYKSVKLNKTKVTLKKGKTFKIKAKEIAVSKKLKVKRHRKVCYESSNKKIASVNKKGVIKAKKKGKCLIYVYTQSGTYKTIKLTVK